MKWLLTVQLVRHAFVQDARGDGFRYSMGGEKQPPSFARITVANMAKRSIVPYLNSLKPSAVKRVKDEIEREIDNLISSFTWTASSPRG